MPSATTHEFLARDRKVNRVVHVILECYPAGQSMQATLDAVRRWKGDDWARAAICAGTRPLSPTSQTAVLERLEVML